MNMSCAGVRRCVSTLTLATFEHFFDTLRLSLFASMTTPTEGVRLDGAGDAAAEETPGQVAVEEPGTGAKGEEDAVVVENVGGAVPTGEQQEQPLSKNAQKRARRAELHAERKRARKEQEKEAKAARRDAQRAEFHAKINAMSEEEKDKYFAERKERLDAKRKEAEAKREAKRAQLSSEYGCLIDCEFSELMTRPKEWSSFAHQCRYLYERNCKAPTPFKLTFTGVAGEFGEHMRRCIGGYDHWHVVSREDTIAESMSEEERASLVYLTADSENELSTLEKGKTYVIGGFIDRNRHKGLTHSKAKELGIAHARLPISENLKMTGATVLTVNQAFDILTRFLEFGDWSQAVAAAVPQRKVDGGKDVNAGDDADASS